MGERKVLNKYFPPDFDPALLPKNAPGGYSVVKVRFMLPCSMQCSECGNFIYRGTKFNARQENAPEHDYLNIRVLRFYIYCGGCSNQICLRTDPKNTDYVVEGGALRNFEPHRQLQFAEKLKELKRSEDDPIAVLENRTTASKREMDILDALEEIQEKNARAAEILASDGVFSVQRSAATQQKMLEAEADLKLASSVTFGRSNGGDGNHRIDDDDSGGEAGPTKASSTLPGASASIATTTTSLFSNGNALGGAGSSLASGGLPPTVSVVMKKRLSAAEKQQAKRAKKAKAAPKPAAPLELVSAYGSSSGDSAGDAASPKGKK